MSAVTTHVLDAALGQPAAGVAVTMLDGAGTTLVTGITNSDGRIPDFGPELLPVGTYSLLFDTGSYFTATGQIGFYPSITITFALSDPAVHYHVPVLLSPFAYSTYRGS